jgi:hypothetical protein
VRWVHASKARQEASIEALDEPIADADGVGMLGREGSCGIHHALKILDDRCSHHLAIGAWRRLADVFQSCMGLIAVPRAELLEDGGADLLEAKLQYLGLNGIADGFGIDVCVGEVEVGNAKGDRTIAEAGL